MKPFLTFVLVIFCLVFAIEATTPCEKECTDNFLAKNPARCPTKRWNDCAICCLSSCCFQGRGSTDCKVEKCSL